MKKFLRVILFFILSCLFSGAPAPALSQGIDESVKEELKLEQENLKVELERIRVEIRRIMREIAVAMKEQAAALKLELQALKEETNSIRDEIQATLEESKEQFKAENALEPAKGRAIIK